MSGQVGAIVAEKSRAAIKTQVDEGVFVWYGWEGDVDAYLGIPARRR